MQFSISTLTISALLTSLTTATPLLPRTTETINITSLYVRNIDSSIISTEFVIQPNNITCSGSTPALNSSVACDTDKWSFAIAENALNNYLLSVYKETGLAYVFVFQRNLAQATFWLKLRSNLDSVYGGLGFMEEELNC